MLTNISCTSSICCPARMAFALWPLAKDMLLPIRHSLLLNIKPNIACSCRTTPIHRFIIHRVGGSLKHVIDIVACTVADGTAV